MCKQKHILFLNGTRQCKKTVKTLVRAPVAGFFFLLFTFYVYTSAAVDWESLSSLSREHHHATQCQRTTNNNGNIFRYFIYIFKRKERAHEIAMEMASHEIIDHVLHVRSSHGSRLLSPAFFIPFHRHCYGFFSL